MPRSALSPNGATPYPAFKADQSTHESKGCSLILARLGYPLVRLNVLNESVAPFSVGEHFAEMISAIDKNAQGRSGYKNNFRFLKKTFYF
jgi:hypothetical protein